MDITSAAALQAHPLVGAKRDDDAPKGYDDTDELYAKAAFLNKLMAQQREKEQAGVNTQKRKVEAENALANKKAKKRKQHKKNRKRGRK